MLISDELKNLMKVRREASWHLSLVKRTNDETRIKRAQDKYNEAMQDLYRFEVSLLERIEALEKAHKI